MHIKYKTNLKLNVVRISLILVAIFSLFILLVIPTFFLSSEIDSVTGWGNNFDNWAEVSIQSQIISYILVATAVAGLYLWLRKFNPKMSLNATTKSIAKSKTKILILLIALSLMTLLIAIYSTP